MKKRKLKFVTWSLHCKNEVKVMPSACLVSLGIKMAHTNNVSNTYISSA